jgi:hypothetical protein
MKNLIEYKKDVERELMIKIIIGLRHGTISETKAEYLAKEYTSLMNIESVDEFFSNLAQRVNKYTEILDVYIRSANEHFTHKTEELLKNGRIFIKNAQYDQAVIALRGEKLHG